MLDQPDRGGDTKALHPRESLPKANAPSEPSFAPKRDDTGRFRKGIRRWSIYAAGMIVSLITAWHFGLPLLLGPVVTVHPAVRTNFVQTIVASGHVEAPFRVNIGSQIVGIVADVPVAEGQTVQVGDPLIVLDDREARAAVAESEGAVAQAEARMRQLQEFALPSAKEDLREAKATLRNAEQAYDRTSQLAQDGFATRAALDDARRARDVARAQVRNAELRVYTNQPGGSDYRLAETLLNQARANLVATRLRLSYTVIEAPRDGVLISRDVERGNIVQPSMVLMQLSPLADTQIVVQVDEKNLGLLRLGQKAIASADAYPKDFFAAEIVYINPGIDLQRASVQVKLRVPEPPAYLLQDMTVSVDIETARHDDALIIPATGIRGQAGSQPWVLIADGAHARRRAVELGLVSGGKAEILEGIEEGDLIIPAAATVEEGDRLRARIPGQNAP